MQQNQYGQVYQGNDDFRGWLAAGGAGTLNPYQLGITGQAPLNSQGTYSLLLNNVGNDGRSSDATYDKAGQALYSVWQGGRKTTNNDTGNTVNWNTVNQLSQGLGTMQGALDRLPGQLDIAKGNIAKQYSQRDNELTSGFNQSKNVYDTSTTQNQQSYRTNKNSINDQASSGLRGLLRMLGSYGAVGSDMGLAGRAVQDSASQQNAGASQTYAQNQQGLDTNWGNYQTQYGNEKTKLNDWQTQQLNEVEQKSLTTRQDLLSKLADLKGQIAAAKGGSYAGAAQPYLDQASTLNGQIDQLSAFNPTYTGTTPVYTAPSLASYNATNRATLTQAPQAADGSTPYFSLLLGKDNKPKQPVIG